jgi:hypothetical protein
MTTLEKTSRQATERTRPTITNGKADLVDAVVDLRNGVAADAREILARWQPALKRAGFLASARQSGRLSRVPPARRADPS